MSDKDKKRTKLAALAKLRMRDTQENLSRLYMQVGDFHGGLYDEWGMISPWTKSAANVDAQLMIIGQDWYSEKAILKSETPWHCGYNPEAPTNKNLFALLKDAFRLDFSDVYATNLFVFIKAGAANSSIPSRDLLYSAKAYTLNEIDIVAPRAIVCLGSATYRILCRALQVAPQPFKSSYVTPVTYGNSFIFGVPHPGRLGTNKAGGMTKVRGIWTQMAGSIPK